MPAVLLLKRAEQLIEMNLGILIKNISFEPKLARLSIILRDSTLFFVRYNDHDEYSYSLVFLNKELDRVRFDNHDDRRNVVSRPHHFHPRMNEEAFSSPMIGLPDDNIPIISRLILDKELWRNELRFT